jgi:hypothetical protein
MSDVQGIGHARTPVRGCDAAARLLNTDPGAYAAALSNAPTPMPRPRLASPLILGLAALGMALCSLPHALGAWPHFREDLVALGADARLVGAIGSAWAFGTVMMLACGAVVGAQAVRTWRGDAPQPATLLPISLAWAAYGLVAFALRDFNTHYLAFVACGAAVSVALVVSRVR